MKLITLFLAIVSFSCLALAQTLAPEIAPLAAKYDADIKSLDASRTAARAHLQRTYLADLDSEEKTATTSGKVAEVAAILKSREIVSTQPSEAKPPSGLSKAQEKRYTDYFSSLAAVDREFAPRYQVKTADYLRSLASIGSRLPVTSPARQQIDELKAKLIAATSGSTDLTLNESQRLRDAVVRVPYSWQGEGLNYTEEITFSADGSGKQTYFTFLWKPSGPRTITVTKPDKSKAVVTFNEDFSTYIGTDFDGKRHLKGSRKPN